MSCRRPSPCTSAAIGPLPSPRNSTRSSPMRITALRRSPLSSASCRYDTSSYGVLTPRYESRSEEHTSELQSRSDLVCRLLLEKKKKNRDQRGLDTGSDVGRTI